MKKLASTLLLFAVTTPLVYPQEAYKLPSITVTATRFETNLERLPDPVVVLTSDEIERGGFDVLFDLFRLTPAFSLKRTGGPGQWTTVRFRGAKAKHLLLLVNGVRISDPSTPSDDFGEILSYLDTADIERVEIVGGPQSALYGSDAASGVVNVITAGAKGERRLWLKTEGGSLGRLKASGAAAGQIADLSYSIALSGERAGGVLDHEEFKNKTASLNLRYKVSGKTSLDLFGRFLDAFVNYSHWNSLTFKAYPDPRAYKYTKSLLLSMGIEHEVSKSLSLKGRLSFNRTRRRYDDEDDGVLDAEDNVKDYPLKAHYKGTNLQGSFQAIFKPNDRLKGAVGLDLLRQSAEAGFEGDLWVGSGYLSCHALLGDSFGLSLAARFDEHSISGNSFTYKLGGAYAIEKLGLKLRGCIGTGFKAPSLYQMLNPNYGNENLKPERSLGLNVGLEKKLLGERARVGIDLFRTEFRDMIAFESLFDEQGNWIGGRYVNRESAETRGAELSIAVAPTDKLVLETRYSYVDGKEEDKPLTLVPKHSLTFKALIGLGGFDGGLYIYRVGERLAFDREHKLEPYTRVDLSLGYKATDRLGLFIKVENLFDVDYQEAGGYRAPGLCVFGGAKLGL